MYTFAACQCCPIKNTPLPLKEQSPRPTLNYKAVPLSNPAQHILLNYVWLANKHRA
jgi:hypothetical protein